MCVSPRGHEYARAKKYIGTTFAVFFQITARITYFDFSLAIADNKMMSFRQVILIKNIQSLLLHVEAYDTIYEGKAFVKVFGYRFFFTYYHTHKMNGVNGYGEFLIG